LEVRDSSGPVGRLNELELDPVEGLILANIFGSDLIAAIDPAAGLVAYYLDLSAVAAAERARSPRPVEAVLNGLAFDEDGRLWVTGKLWSALYQLSYDRP
jgi:glutaminyl-peptide cyclotransferase